MSWGCMPELIASIAVIAIIAVIIGMFLGFIKVLQNTHDTAHRPQQTTEQKVEESTKEHSKPKRGSYIIRYKLEVEYPNGKHGVVIMNRDASACYHRLMPCKFRFTVKEVRSNGRLLIFLCEILSNRIPVSNIPFDPEFHSIYEFNLDRGFYKIDGIPVDVYSTTFEKYGDKTYKVIGLLDSDIIDKCDHLIYDCTTKTHYKSLKIR